MEYRYMGRTGLQLSVLSFGSWVSFHKQINDKIADELMGLAYDNGVNFFDNAEGKIIHVGILLENHHIIHAHGCVRIDRIDQTGIYNADTGKHSHQLRLIKRYF